MSGNKTEYLVFPSVYSVLVYPDNDTVISAARWLVISAGADFFFFYEHDLQTHIHRLRKCIGILWLIMWNKRELTLSIAVLILPASVFIVLFCLSIFLMNHVRYQFVKDVTPRSVELQNR